jgi:hypothetical protein
VRTIFIWLTLAGAAPAVAQEAAPATAPAARPDAIDPARLALARTAVDGVWPVGTYERMMRGTMGEMMDGMMAAMFDMKLGDMVPADVATKDPGLARQTMREAMAKEDPHFLERMRIMNRVMFEEMIPMMNRIEPGVREGLSRAYARKFTSAQLEDINRFLATATGRVYGPEAMLAFMDPEVMSQISKLSPDL